MYTYVYICRFVIPSFYIIATVANYILLLSLIINNNNNILLIHLLGNIRVIVNLSVLNSIELYYLSSYYYYLLLVVGR